MILYHTLTLNNVIAPAIHKPKTENLQVQFYGRLSNADGISALVGLVFLVPHTVSPICP